MIRLIRVTGFMLIGCGAVIVAIWTIKPLRFIWPWLRMLPWPVQLGFAIAGIGLVVLMASIIWERMEDQSGDRDLLDD